MKSLSSLVLVASADIVEGKKTNRVKIHEGRGRPAKKRLQPTEVSPQRALARFRKDPSMAGRLYTVISSSLPVDELAAMDEACERIGIARSQFIREACKRYREHLEHGNQEQMWRAP